MSEITNSNSIELFKNETINNIINCNWIPIESKGFIINEMNFEI